jgi:hypothetical protein
MISSAYSPHGVRAVTLYEHVRRAVDVESEIATPQA